MKIYKLRRTFFSSKRVLIEKLVEVRSKSKLILELSHQVNETTITKCDIINMLIARLYV